MNNKNRRSQVSRYLSWVLLVSIALLSTGCSWLFGDQGHFRERTMDYQKAKETNALRFPPGVHTENMAELYPIPRVSAQGEFVPLSAEDIPRPQS